MALVLLLGGGLGWVVHCARVQRDAVSAIRRAGGNVFYDNHLNTTGRSEVHIEGSTDDVNSVLTIKGSLFITLAQTSGTASDSTIANNKALGGEEGAGGSDGHGVGGGVYNLGTFISDVTTVIAHNHASTSDDNTFGV